MKTKFRISLLILIGFVLLSLTGCVGIPISEPGLVVGQSYRLHSGETLERDLTVIGGNARIDEGATVNGDTVVIGGDVTIDGAINGNLSVLGGYVSLGNSAVIEGSLDTVGGTVQRASGAVVQGRDLGDRPVVPNITTWSSPAMNISFEPVTATLMAIFQALAMAALAIVINLFAPRPMERTAQAGITQSPASGGVGCLTILVLVIMAITIILLPISILGLLLAGVAALYGWVSLGLALGRQLNVWLKQTWSEPVNAGVGTLVLTLLASLLNIIPCIGWTISFIVALVALGAVILTRFGTQIYPSPGTYPPAPRAYPPAPIEPRDEEIPDARIYPSTEENEPPAPPNQNPYE